MANNEVLDIKDLDTFIFHGTWFDHIQSLPEETQAKIITDLCRYGVGKEPLFEDDPVVIAMVSVLKGGVDNSKNGYLKKVNMGQKAGRKKKYSDEEIYKLSREGYTVEEMAVELNCSESTIRHSPGYMNRKNDKFEF